MEDDKIYSAYIAAFEHNISRWRCIYTWSHRMEWNGMEYNNDDTMWFWLDDPTHKLKWWLLISEMQ